ncbi:SDR family oxidoreductase [Novosphingobium sp. FKTRR1]|uniref:SDR family oxidoreductase n=1 Tax=Novosphingobium sp. FKTRR1 TaxID=2879118 RepID=UPI001CF05319|nr:SDR family oxidoreductase [Novosphingobium sp. FKTRR1]
MTRTIVITGAASGIGKATAELCRAAGDTVIGVDLSGTDISADLSSPEGRATMIDEVHRLAPSGIDSLLAGAGVSRPDAITIAVNYFGAVATLEGLRPLLAKSPCPRAVAICSTAAILQGNDAVVQACLAGDEAAALAACATAPMSAYPDSKRALSLWLRSAAVRPEWAGAGISLNGIAPGVVLSPMTAPLFEDPAMVAAIRQSNPIVTRAYAQPEEIAETIRFLLTVNSAYLLGQILFVDGGSDALLRPGQF